MQVLSEADLVRDEPLGARKGSIGEKDDLLHHRVLAKRVAELAVSSVGNVNIALFGPWGSGKSSFHALLREELKKNPVKTQHITFDAWKNAGTGFRTNFLYEVAEQVDADVKISDTLFQSTSSVRGPLADLKWSTAVRVWTLVGFLGVIFFGLPALWTLIQLLLGVQRQYGSLFIENFSAFSSMAASGTVFVVVLLAVIELSKVTVSKSTPSHVAQFGKLFDNILDTKKKHRMVIFIDELDRCSPKDVMATLEGLRTFLGHPRCVFVVAFDREAVAGVIANELGQNVPRENAAPYYRTSGEYLDKIFQFQLALPPQPVHTFRRFAASLVRERGGVWGQLRAQSPDLLDRVVNILSPMHLASPRRTKVLLNDFAVNARVYEGMGFSWLERAEEIAVLTVLQTEFPRLAADLEKEPALMRFLYRQEVPTRQSLLDLVEQYSEGGAADGVPLDEVVGKDNRGEVAEQLEENLQRYLRLLRERHVPEPRADLIMMHSDGSLLAFNDPGVYHELLSAADMPRQDVINALSGASEHDLEQAIRYLLDQTEKETKDASDRLVVLAGEVAAELETINPDLARLLGGRASSSVERMTLQSVQGYSAAVAVVYTEAELKAVLNVAAAQADAGVVQVVKSLTDSLRDDDWESARDHMLPLVLQHALSVPDVASAFFVRFSQDLEAELSWKQIDALAAGLTAKAPEPVEPAAATAAAKTAAEEQDAENDAAYEGQREANRGIAAELAAGWAEMALGSEMRRDFLRILRRVEKNQGFFNLHDSLIDRDIERGQAAEANSLLLGAILERPPRAHSRWADKLDANATVSSSLKQDALHAVLALVAESGHETVRESGAAAAQRIAALPSDAFDHQKFDDLVHGDLATDWSEYSDSRFETQLRLLNVLDTLEAVHSDGTEDSERATDADRAELYVTATVAAQTEGADVRTIVLAVEKERPSFAASVAGRLTEAKPWEQAPPELPVRVILAAQHRALAGGVSITHLPPEAFFGIADAKLSRALAASWLSTAPLVSEVERLPNAASLPQEAWRRYGANATEEQRGAAWRFLMKKDGLLGQLRTLSEPGQAVTIYEETAAAVREAKTVAPRERAVKAFLALPATRDAADEVRAMIKVMAQDKKRTELALGLLLLRAYVSELSSTAVRTLRPLVSAWAEEGEGLVAKKDISWLVDRGFATKKSPLRDVVKRMSGRG
ncbi:P-loop NTPase fold protein [Microbacterium sp. A8/3-1]|uniref:P-loop NTPase fold protein n=1 Tax=Microbacterium sp. A8/3-1 TaxID=3160749 RepID=A0AAU7VXG3_9MICO